MSFPKRFYWAALQPRNQCERQLERRWKRTGQNRCDNRWFPKKSRGSRTHAGRNRRHGGRIFPIPEGASMQCWTDIIIEPQGDWIFIIIIKKTLHYLQKWDLRYSVCRFPGPGSRRGVKRIQP